MKRLLYILTISCLLLSCETEVEFKGEVKAPKLVLRSTLQEGETEIYAYLTRSRFFLDNSQYSSQGYYNGGNKASKEGVIDGAQIQYQLNSPAWVSMTADYDSVRNSTCYKATGIKLKPGDMVAMRVSHSDYDTISAVQVIPTTVDYTIVRQDYSNGVYTVELDLSPYQGASTDVIAISLSGRVTSYTSGYYAQSNSAALSQTFHSANTVFGDGANLRSNKLNYYPMDRYLLLPASAIGTGGMTLEFVFNFDIRPRTNDQTAVYQLLTEANVEAWTQDTYLNYSSMMAYMGRADDNDANSYEKEKTNDYAVDYVEMITDIMNDISSEFGVESGVQIYSNIENGYGCLSAKSTMKKRKTSYVPRDN